jgi:hypothetical protein
VEQSLQEQITRLLAQIDAFEHTQEQGTAEETITIVGNDEARRPRRVVNVYIDIEEEAEDRGDVETNPPIIESTLNHVVVEPRTSEIPTPTYQTNAIGTTPLPRVQQRDRSHLFLILCFTLCLLVIGIMSVLYLVPLFAANATVTIIPVSKQISTTSIVHVIPGSATAQQLSGRILSAASMSRAQTVPTTGIVHQEARAGRGYITFYNAAPSAQIVSVGTLIPAPNGVAVITEQDAVVPAAVYPLFGQATVTAHATITGPGGNLHAGEIYGPCCRLNLSAVNGAFHGGQAARTYSTVSAEDMQTVITNLKASLDKSVQAALQAQVHADETLLASLPCQQTTSADHQIGDEAQQVRVTMSETCTGETYNTEAYHDLATQTVSQEVTQQLGEGYTLVGDIQVTTNTTTVKGHGVIDLQVTIAGIWAYQFTKAECEQIKAMVAGKSKAQTITTLLQVPGVSSASVSIEHGDSVPSESKSIQVVVLQMVG